MRYARADRLIQLALEMRAARGGLTLADIQDRFGVSRRTAIRMRNAVVQAFPQADEVPSNDRTRRWRLDRADLQPLMTITAEDLAALATAVEILGRENLDGEADALRGLGAKVKAGMAAQLMRRIEPDLEALAVAEGLALRPGPRPAIPASRFAALRGAILACRKVSFRYDSRTTGGIADRVVRPLGFLYGHRHYLVAEKDSPGVPGEGSRIRFFSLPQISRVKLLPQGFERPPGFDLKSFVAGSFGVFEEPVQDVVWKFSAEAAPFARGFQFHPSQLLEPQPDGGLIVRFRAGGLLEMAWHLMSWGRHVEVLAPAALRAMLPAELPDWPALP